MRNWNFQLHDQHGKAILGSGGKAYVAVNGDAAKATLYDATGASLANPVTLTQGKVDFWTDDDTSKVDVYIQAPGGQFVVIHDLDASGPGKLTVDTNQRHQTMVIPFAIGDTTANTETNTGFTVPSGAAVLPTPLVDVLTLDDTETIDVGTLSSDSGDADGFMDGVSVGTAGVKQGSLATGAVTLGVLLSVQDSANAGDLVPEPDITMGGKTITYTLSAGTDTAEGFIVLPIILGNVR